MAAAVGLIVVGIVAVLGGAYDGQVVRDQLVPQKIFFPAAGGPGLLAGESQSPVGGRPPCVMSRGAAAAER